MISLDVEFIQRSYVLSCSLTCTPRHVCILSPVCRIHLEKSGNLMRLESGRP